jgi:Lrp/AsnC family leucine-responsive transcriptional regulator
VDSFDFYILRHLISRGRSRWADLARSLGLSSPSIMERVRKLEEAGVIRGYAALISPKKVGLTLTAFLSVTLDHPRHREPFLQFIERSPEIQECHHVAGDHDYLLKVRCRDTDNLEDLISNRIKELPGIAATRTDIVLSTCKETVALPLPAPPAEGRRGRS